MAKEEVKYMGSTKKQIWDAYKEVLDRLNSYEKPLSTVEAAKKKDDDDAVHTAESTDCISLTNDISGMVDKIKESHEFLLKINRAISVKKKELSDIHGIEAQANSAAAFAAAQEQYLQERDEHLKELEDEFNEALEERKKAEEQRVEEWEYNFRIKKRDAQDRLNQQMQQQLDEIIKREKEVGDAENVIKELKSEVSILEYDMENKIKEAVEKAKKDAEKGAAISRQIMESKHQSDMAIKDEINNSLKYKIQDMGKVIDQQKEQIAQMQQQINTMATAALKAQGDAATINRVAEVVASGGNKK